MAPSKVTKGGHDDSKSEDPKPKEKNGNGHGNNHHPNGKARRSNHVANSHLREVTNAAAGSSTAAASSSTQENGNSGIRWTSFERETLHAYRRAHRLNTPTAFENEFHQWVLTQPGSIGLYSPTIARRKELRRQTKEQLTHTVRKHFNGQGVQENDIIVEFLHKVKNQLPSRVQKAKRKEYIHMQPKK